MTPTNKTLAPCTLEQYQEQAVANFWMSGTGNSIMDEEVESWFVHKGLRSHNNTPLSCTEWDTSYGSRARITGDLGLWYDEAIKRVAGTSDEFVKRTYGSLSRTDKATLTRFLREACAIWSGINFQSRYGNGTDYVGSIGPSEATGEVLNSATARELYRGRLTAKTQERAAELAHAFREVALAYRDELESQLARFISDEVEYRERFEAECAAEEFSEKFFGEEGVEEAAA